MTDDENSKMDKSPRALDDATTVFFSYSRKDQAQARPIIDAIRNAGYNIWWDGMLDGGISYLETTEEALETAKVVVVLWSKHSVGSHWVRDEAMSGRVRERLLPLSLDGTEPPLGFRQIQVIDFSNWKWDTQSEACQNLFRGLAHFHDKKLPDFPVSNKRGTGIRPLSRRAMLLGVGGLGAGIIGGYFLTERLGSTSKAPDNSIAVLPFENLSGDPEQDYIATGLSVEIRAKLARNSALKVVARSSSIAAAAEQLSAKDFTKKLGVRYLLEGHIRPVGEKFQVTPTLIEGVTGFSHWSSVFTEPAENMLAVQKAITQNIAAKLAVEQDELNSSSDNGETDNPAAFTEYLKGDALFTAYEDRKSLMKALEHFDQALRLDPNFGAAMTAKAQLLLSLGTTSADVTLAREFINQANNVAQKATEVSPKMADAYSTLGYVRFAGSLDFEGALEPYKKSYELNNGSAAIFARYGVYMATIGQSEVATESIKQALELDPLNATMHNTAGLIHYAARDYQAAISSYRRVLDMSPDFFNARAYMGLSLIRSGNVDGGLLICQDETNTMERLPCLAIGEHRAGNIEAAQAAFDDLVERFGEAGAYQQVQVLADWGEIEQAMTVLKRAVELGDSGLSLAKFDPALDNLRDRSDFAEILAELGFTG